ncbi:Imm26 family immunity protein [Pseudomonas sp. KNUC1026]|uniref:Imm26 family immunity protein n=1 Tax=Pseudomonas sp. KNUC1026 TaxID=2893890 RepID=UPI001F37A4DB|nr:Imm26 family immunity protein [Pseudomonas sp. KNUC1026]UFH49887.1 immunity 26/phosphotriesterase HocA family protein [Pseudomonas sp. KNUC1026]
MKHKFEPGDLFLLPITAGGFALCQIVSVFKDRFKKIFSFGVMQISSSDLELELIERDYLQFENARGREQLIFTSTEKLNSGEWVIVGHVPLTPTKLTFRYFRVSYNLYCDDVLLGNLDKIKAKKYNVMAVAGFELVQSYLQQLSGNGPS